MTKFDNVDVGVPMQKLVNQYNRQRNETIEEVAAHLDNRNMQIAAQEVRSLKVQEQDNGKDSTSDV